MYVFLHVPPPSFITRISATSRDIVTCRVVPLISPITSPITVPPRSSVSFRKQPHGIPTFHRFVRRPRESVYLLYAQSTFFCRVVQIFDSFYPISLIKSYSNPCFWMFSHFHLWTGWSNSFISIQVKTPRVSQRLGKRDRACYVFFFFFFSFLFKRSKPGKRNLLLRQVAAIMQKEAPNLAHFVWHTLLLLLPLIVSYYGTRYLLSLRA